MINVLCLCAAVALLENPALNPVTVLPVPAPHAPLVLVRDGEPRFAIVCDAKAERRRFPYGWQRQWRSAELAAQTLATNVWRATGRTVRILPAGAPVPNGMLAVYVGESTATKALGLESAALPHEGFVVRTFADGVAIVGEDSSLSSSFDPKEPGDKHLGTVWGVYDFVERFFGARFYNPGPDGSVHPKVRDLVLEPFAYSDAPAFVNRGGYYLRCPPGPTAKALGVGITARDEADYLLSMRRAKTVAFTSMHSPFVYEWLAHDPSRAEDSIFRGASGRRYFDERKGERCYFDVFGTNFAERLIASFRESCAAGKSDRQGMPYNNRHYVSFGQCDGSVSLFDAWNDPNVRREGLMTEENLRIGNLAYLSDVYARFYIYMGERLKTVLPDKKLIVMPYSQYIHPPLQERFGRIPDNVEPGVCLTDMPRCFRNEERRARAKRILSGWRKALGGRPVKEVWTYSCNCSAFVHDAAGEDMGEMIRFFGEDLGRYQVFHELCMNHTALPDDRFTAYSFPHVTYVVMRAVWNPAFDKDAALAEFWPLYYGAAGEMLGEAHRVLREALRRVAAPACDGEPIFPVKVVDRVEQLLDAAEAKLPEGTPERRRYETYAGMLRFEIARQRKRQDERVPYSDPRLPPDALCVARTVAVSNGMLAITRPYAGWGGQYLAYSRTGHLVGDRNEYGVNYLMNRPKRGGPPRTFVNLLEPRIHGGFGRESVNFLRLTVNGMSMEQTVPGKDAFRTFVTGDAATAEMLFDFDGAVVKVSAILKKGSPLLFLDVTPVAGTKPVESATVSVRCVPSWENARKDGRTPPHAREAVTARGKTSATVDWKAKAKTVPLAEGDRYVILQDAVLDGSSAEKGAGPSLVRLPDDFTGLASASVSVSAESVASVTFEAAKPFKGLSFAILQTPTRVSNDEFPVRYAECLR